MVGSAVGSGGKAEAREGGVFRSIPKGRVLEMGEGTRVGMGMERER